MPSPDASETDSSRPVLPTGDSQPATNESQAVTADYNSRSESLNGSSDKQTNGPVLDSISESKQNAKIMLPASGVSPANSNLSEGQQQHTANGTNGINASRKRSRSGSVISSSAPENAPATVRETPVEKVLLEQYVYREFQHSALEATRNKSQELFQQKRAERDYLLALRRENQLNPAAIYGVGYEGYGNARTDLRNQHPQLLYPANRRRPGGRKTRELRISRKDLKAQSELREDLVPIRLDCDWDKVKIRDTFTWNLHDRVTSPELFAEKLVEDLGLQPETCAPLIRQITQSIQEQLTDYFPHVYMEEEPLDPHLPYEAYKNDEMRVLVKLNITIGQHTLVDQIEWDINNPYNSPEDFALQMTNDLSLSGEFTTAIAHSIREQVQLFTRSLYITAHPFDGRPVDDPDLKAAFLPSPMPSTFRPFQAAKDFTPYLYELNEAELERTEVSISREQRRQKRSVNRRGGPALPDLKDRQRTIRTMIVSSVIPNSAASIDETRLFKRSGSGRTRRAGGGQRDGLDDSDLSDSDDSSVGSPAIGVHLAQGTARTRGMRGAASAAQAAMRANLAQSATPEPASHHHETRISRRRDYREESSEEPEKLVVTFRIAKDRFRQLVSDLSNRKRPVTPNFPVQVPTSKSSTPQLATPIQSNMLPPSTQPQHASTSRPGSTSAAPQSHTPTPQIGAVDAPHPPQPGVPPPAAPSWLISGLEKLKKGYPNDRFEGVMRYSAVDTATMNPVATSSGPPPNIKLKYQYLPRIRCLDCPGKLYTPGPGMTVENFEVHLRNRLHKERVEARLARSVGGSAGTTPA
ncbi:SWI-SNF complex subunit (Snf5), putative [Talaromyces stipitatus ATCC 10500]|uniref:SWI-SNF complex subunit (Snf5), putative n=1 Tax=Talaromyces stipitatus (strain ATCC 10500 / CBS 375.48 / QM 6759 / NRRL 1006) TaxID=441959 RepID=B8MPX2_TALSN|nr:SWI-SNF complex subunit (Snf5), putative [Talaromyces stipitatus ATCC 10500]EED12862.1 SWI-SNF complex subunit (Snf5), putative [Talaromyces stipitatus ATCC 10500]